MKLMYFSKEELKEVFPLNSLKLKEDRDEFINLPLDEDTVFYITKNNFEEVYSDSDRIEVEVAPDEFKKYFKTETSIAIADNELSVINHFYENLEHYNSDIESIYSLDFYINFSKIFSKMKITNLIKNTKMFSRKKTYYCMFVKDSNEDLLNEDYIYNDYEERYIPPTIAYRKIMSNSIAELKDYIDKWEQRGFFLYLIKTDKEVDFIIEKLELATRGKSTERNKSIINDCYCPNPALLVHDIVMPILPFKEAKKNKPDMTQEEYDFWAENIRSVEEDERIEKEEILTAKRKDIEKTINDELHDFYYKYTMERLTGYTGKFIGKKPLLEKSEKRNIKG